MHHQWEAAAPDANIVTATLTVHLSSLHRQIALPLDWPDHQAGDTWTEDIPLEIGYATARVQQVEWLGTTDDGRARLRLTVSDESPADIRLHCLHLDTADPWQNTCANFDGQQSYTLTVQPDEPVILHLRAGLELLTPFRLVLTPSDAVEPTNAQEEWLTYENSDYGFSFIYPPDWTLIESPNRIALAHQGSSISLRVEVKYVGEDIEIVRSGVPAGDLISRGTLIFLGQQLARNVLVYHDKDKAVLYDNAGEIEVGDLLFVITLESNRADYESIEIPEDIQEEADEILESFTLLE
jgi:hypothetical protein